MNKKLLLAMAIPTVLVGCSQDEFVSENGNNAVAAGGKAISGVTFSIEKSGQDADTRATWLENDYKVAFEKDDNISLFWVDEDKLTQNNTDGKFTGTAKALTGPLDGKSNAVFYTEDGGKFESKAVVYEGYNLLVYPADLAHVTNQKVVVSVDGEQKADNDFTKSLVYVGDSILQIHQPSEKWDNNKFVGYYDMWNQPCGTEDPNTSGYQHGIKTGAKMLTSLLDFTFRIENVAADQEVKIRKVTLTTTDPSEEIFATSGNIIPQAVSQFVKKADGTNIAPAVVGSKSQYLNPWFQAAETASEVSFDCENITTDKAGTRVRMVVLPIATPSTATKPVIKVETNLGIVTIGSNATSTNQLNCIYQANGIDYADATDEAAMATIVQRTANTDGREIKNAAGAVVATYKVTSGSYIPRVIKVDMQRAEIQDVHVKNTTELNNILAAACTKADKTYSSDTGKPLNIFLDYDKEGYFELTNYDGLDAFVKKFKEGALKLTSGKCTNGSLAALKSIKVNTTEATALKKIEGLDPAVTLTIPATSKITSIANGTSSNRNVIANLITNQTTLSAGNYTTATIENDKAVLNMTATSIVTLSSNAGGTVNYVAGSNNLDVTALNTANYGTIAYTATTYSGMETAMKAGVNQVTVSGINVGFFSQKIVGIDAANYPADTQGNGVELIFDNCGDLGNLQAGMEATTVTMKGGTTCTKLASIDVKNWNLYDTTTLGATVANSSLGSSAARKNVEKVRVWNGIATINGVKATHLAVYSGATATLTVNAWAPTNLAVEGTVTFNASGETGKLKTQNGKVVRDGAVQDDELTELVVTGSLATNKDIIADKVYVGPNTAITLSGNIKGVASSATVVATRFEQIAGTANFTHLNTNGGQQIWSGLTTVWNGQY